MLLIYSAYFLWAEVEQAKSEKKANKNSMKKYFTEIWNYTDFIPPVLIIFIVLGDIFVDTSANDGGIISFKYSMQALASFGMWLKIFYFLRIFRQTGFFVNMFLRVVKISGTFFLLYMLTLLAFACSFYIMTS